MHNLTRKILVFFVILAAISLLFVMTRQAAGNKVKTPKDYMSQTPLETCKELGKKGELLKEKIDFEKLYNVISKHLKREYLLTPKALKKYARFAFGKGYWVLSVGPYKIKDKFIHIGCRGSGFSISVSPFPLDLDIDKNKEEVRELTSRYFKTAFLKGETQEGSWEIWASHGKLEYHWTKKGVFSDIRAVLEYPEFLKVEEIIKQEWEKAKASLDIDKIYDFLLKHLRKERLPARKDFFSLVRLDRARCDLGMYGEEKSLPSTYEFLKICNPFSLSMEFKINDKSFEIGLRPGYVNSDFLWIHISPFKEKLSPQDFKKIINGFFTTLPEEPLLEFKGEEIKLGWKQGENKYRIWYNPDIGSDLHYTCSYKLGRFSNQLESFRSSAKNSN